MPGGIAATSVGGGWARFVSDQNLGHGALLTFEVVDDWRLVVALHRRSGAEDCTPVRRRVRLQCRPCLPQARASPPVQLPTRALDCAHRSPVRRSATVPEDTPQEPHEEARIVQTCKRKLQFPLMSPIALQVFGFTPCCLFYSRRRTARQVANVVRICLVMW